MNHGPPVVPFSDWLTQCSVTRPSEAVFEGYPLVLRLSFHRFLEVAVDGCRWF